MEVLPINNVNHANLTGWKYNHNPYITSEEDGYWNELSQLLGEELRAAKSTHLSCGEVLLPCGLLQRISRDILAMAESEPCGLRGCTLYLNFEGDQDCRRLSTVRCDPTTASTFEVYLTLKQASAGWNSFLPQFLKKITRGGTMMISTDYQLDKNKLYRSYID